MMRATIKDYAKLLADDGLLVASNTMGVSNIPVENLTYDSRKAGRGTLFVCKGSRFRGEYLEEALRRGAICFVAEKTYGFEQLPHLLVNDIRCAMAVLAREFYMAPEMSLHTIGVTGTKGKTTTTLYIKAIYDVWLAKRKQKEMGCISSIGILDGFGRETSRITTPEAMEIFRHMRNICDSQMSHVVMEISSQALKYQRVRGIYFETGIFLNIAEDHISPLEHSDFEDYFRSKLKLFSQCGTAVVNLDSDRRERILEAARQAKRAVTFGKTEEADICGYDVRVGKEKIFFRARCDRFDEEFSLHMHGSFNVENALAAIAAAYIDNIPVEDIREGLAHVTIPGRMEEYTSPRRRVTAIVDYAHNGLSYRKLFDAVREEFPGYRVISVFGCPGGKAYNRRRDMGLLAGRFSSKVFVTTDDPGPEPAKKISKEIASYVRRVGDCACECVDDRKTAICRAIAEADERTVILILGKGNEHTQKIGERYVKYGPDAAIVRECLA